MYSCSEVYSAQGTDCCAGSFEANITYDGVSSIFTIANSGWVLNPCHFGSFQIHGMVANGTLEGSLISTAADMHSCDAVSLKNKWADSTVDIASLPSDFNFASSALSPILDQGKCG